MTTMKYHKERMSAEFTKHLIDLDGGKGYRPFHLVVHHFTGRDKGNPHDHPFRFTSYVLKGGYTERIHYKDVYGNWWSKEVFRAPGTTHVVEAECIHEIIDLPEGECWTVIQPEQKVRESRFWKFEPGRVQSRAWHERKWTQH